MSEPVDAWEELELIARVEAWIAEVDAAYDDGGYAAGDGPTVLLDETRWLLDQRTKLLGIINAWHGLANHVSRIVEAAPRMPATDLYDALAVDFDRIAKARRPAASLSPREPTEENEQ